jgi:hypothetical protein
MLSCIVAGMTTRMMLTEMGCTEHHHVVGQQIVVLSGSQSVSCFVSLKIAVPINHDSCGVGLLSSCSWDRANHMRRCNK